MPMNNKTGQSKIYASVSAPEHGCEQLFKLNEVKFHGSQIEIEEAKSTRQQTIFVSSPAKNHPVVVNKNLKKQSSLQNFSSLVPGKRNYCKTVQPRSSPYNTLIFMDNVAKGIRMCKFNSFQRNRKMELKFPRVFI